MINELNKDFCIFCKQFDVSLELSYTKSTNGVSASTGRSLDDLQLISKDF